MSKISRDQLQELAERIQHLYLSDHIPWVLGYSGGKDSTATLQLVWNAISNLPKDRQQHKQIYVISTDTLVEQPIVAAWVKRSLRLMRQASIEQKLPFHVEPLTPTIENSFWVNLIGRGYPAPRAGFRWCTSRLKIDPSNRFITKLTKRYGETILVLGTRKAESVSRAATMNYYEKSRIREWLSPNGSLMNSWVFSPIEDWTSNDVWMYLMQVKNPWGLDNKELMTMYREATNDNECPLVVDTTTPSCGNSRFGCWVCTLVSADKSMEAMIQNDEENIWMSPLLDFRNELGKLNERGRIDDHEHRDFRRMNGSIKMYQKLDKTIPGPYTKSYREYLLKRLLEVQVKVKELMPSTMAEFELISIDELRLIRKIWVKDKLEFDDALPRIYEKTIYKPWVDSNRFTSFGEEEWNILSEITGNNPIALDLHASLLMLEENHSILNGKRSIISEMESHIRRCFYENESDAFLFKKRQTELRGLSSDDLEDLLSDEIGIEEI